MVEHKSSDPETGRERVLAVNNNIHNFQAIMASLLQSNFPRGITGGVQTDGQGTAGKMPSWEDFAKMSKEALGGQNFAQFEENAQASEAFLKGLWDSLMGFNEENGDGEGQQAPKRKAAPGQLTGFEPILDQAPINFGQNQGGAGNLGALGQGGNPQAAQGWNQGREGNCASVATIKAAQTKFGKDIFKNVQQNGNGGVNVTLQDGKQISVTKEELDTAKRMSGFQGQGEGLDSAQLCYAVMAKNALQSGHEGARTFAQACHSLNNGEDPFKSAQFLGIEGRIKRVDPRTAAASGAAVVWSQQHALFQSGGAVDKYGQQVAFNGTDTLGQRLVDAFVLV
jgi:hypothetical protein